MTMMGMGMMNLSMMNLSKDTELILLPLHTFLHWKPPAAPVFSATDVRKLSAWARHRDLAELFEKHA
jgi:hypothetical protein